MYSVVHIHVCTTTTNVPNESLITYMYQSWRWQCGLYILNTVPGYKTFDTSSYSVPVVGGGLALGGSSMAS